VTRRELAVEDVPVLAWGDWGRPLLVFPSEQGAAHDYESNGMVGVLSWLIDAGRLKIYSVSSFDSWTWADNSVPTEERARRHAHYERWIADHVAPFIHADCGGSAEIMVTGCSLGAYHAANFALKRADLFPLAICLSGVYDVAGKGWGERGDATYFNNPMDYVSHLEGDHLDWLRNRASLVLVCGQGQWEDTTGALESTKRFGALATGKGLRVELDLWGHDVPHDWPSWRRQIAHHIPRFC
jgi:esterase/lipase superfamily enzyme